MRLLTRKLLMGAAVVLLAATPMAGDTPVQNDAFGITLPDGFSEFSKQVQKAASPEGEVETTNWVSRADTGEAVVVTVSKMPGHILDPGKLMDSTRDSLLKTLKATLEREEDLEGDLPSTILVFRSESENPVYLQSRLLVDDDQFYQVLYVGRSEEQRAAPAVSQLFTSFRVAKSMASSSQP
ncbi:MAG TPA: hypothetical protein VNA04_15695 [Thermoanaerobaculia bacterium]|nr:hypothetical protein [Thermoanaerobaculia bacterium]